MSVDQDFLRKFLNIYWLRPENALWRSVNCKAIEDIVFESPSLDSSCGDGLFSFLRAGGDFSTDFDVYQAVGNLDRFRENVDIYDAMATEYAPVVTKRADYKFTVGTDWKENLIAKAAALGLYDEVRVHDNNKPMPFADGSFKTIFSNSAYWIENLDLHLAELCRVLRPDGIAVLVLMTSATRNYTLDHLERFLGAEWLKLIDRGRKENYRGLRSGDEWDGILHKAGFRIIEKRPQVSWVHSYLEYVGLRPISPVMIEMANALSAEKRREIKAKWIEHWAPLLEPFNRPGMDFGRALPPVEYIYILGKG